MAGVDWLQFKQARQAMRGELQHSAKGTTWKNHLYKAKETVSGKVRYIYDSASSKINNKKEEKKDKENDESVFSSVKNAITKKIDEMINGKTIIYDEPVKFKDMSPEEQAMIREVINGLAEELEKEGHSVEVKRYGR